MTEVRKLRKREDEKPIDEVIVMDPASREEMVHEVEEFETNLRPIVVTCQADLERLRDDLALNKAMREKIMDETEPMRASTWLAYKAAKAFQDRQLAPVDADTQARKDAGIAYVDEQKRIAAEAEAARQAELRRQRLEQEALERRRLQEEADRQAEIERRARERQAAIDAEAAAREAEAQALVDAGKSEEADAILEQESEVAEVEEVPELELEPEPEPEPEPQPVAVVPEEYKAPTAVKGLGMGVKYEAIIEDEAAFIAAYQDEHPQIARDAVQTFPKRLLPVVKSMKGKVNIPGVRIVESSSLSNRT